MLWLGPWKERKGKHEGHETRDWARDTRWWCNVFICYGKAKADLFTCAFIVVVMLKPTFALFLKLRYLILNTLIDDTYPSLVILILTPLHYIIPLSSGEKVRCKSSRRADYWELHYWLVRDIIRFAEAEVRR